MSTEILAALNLELWHLTAGAAIGAVVLHGYSLLAKRQEGGKMTPIRVESSRR